jgi:hypothetical protein
MLINKSSDIFGKEKDSLEGIVCSAY